MTPDEARRRCTASRAAQGLPPTVEDPATLARAAVLLGPLPGRPRTRGPSPELAAENARRARAAAVDAARRAAIHAANQATACAVCGVPLPFHHNGPGSHGYEAPP